MPTTTRISAGTSGAPAAYAPGGWPRQRAFLRALALLDEAGVAYVVLNGYERLYAPAGMGAGDLDCVVDPAAVPGRVAALLLENAGRLGVDVISWEGSPNHYIALASKDRDDGSYVAWLDLHPGYERNGRLFFPAAEVLASRRRYADVWIPAPDIEFAYYLVKKLLGDRLGELETQRLTTRFAADPDRCDRRLADLWSPDDARLLGAAARSGEWQSVLMQLPRLRAALLRRFARRHPALVARARLAGVLRRVRRARAPRRSLHLVLLGPDGVGKSTVIEELTAELAALFPDGIAMDTPAGLISRPNAAAGRPHDKTPRGLLGSVAKAMYWLLYYSPGYRINVRLPRRGARLHLSHRYLVDALVDPKRYRYAGPRWLLELVWRFAVKPDLVILLDAPPAIIQARKREVTPEETARQCVAYRTTVAALPNGRIVDASRSVPDVVASVRDEILGFMARRTARRLASRIGDR